MGRPAKHKVIEYNGRRYYRKPTGYYKADHKFGGEYLHRAVWLNERGPIQAGYDVHHKDGDKSRNDIDNLELLSKGDHSRMHGKERFEANPELFRKAVALACKAAPA